MSKTVAHMGVTRQTECLARVARAFPFSFRFPDSQIFHYSPIDVNLEQNYALCNFAYCANRSLHHYTWMCDLRRIRSIYQSANMNIHEATPERNRLSRKKFKTNALSTLEKTRSREEDIKRQQSPLMINAT